MIQLSIILMLIFFVSCGTVDRIGKTAIEEYNFYLNAKKEARNKEISQLTKKEFDQDSKEIILQPPPEIFQSPQEEILQVFLFKVEKDL